MLLDIMISSSRLHNGADRLRHQINSVPDVMNFPNYDFTPHLKRNNYALPVEEDEAPETVYINMKIESDEEPETQYVKLFIEKKRKVNM
jgi:hypothetical protein